MKAEIESSEVKKGLGSLVITVKESGKGWQTEVDIKHLTAKEIMQIMSEVNENILGTIAKSFAESYKTKRDEKAE